MPGAVKGDGEAGGAVLEHAYRESYGRAVATLIRVFGDIDLAEEAVQDAFAVAAQRWPETGCRPTPAAGSSPRPATRRWTACGGRRPPPAVGPRPPPPTGRGRAFLPPPPGQPLDTPRPTPPGPAPAPPAT